MHFCLHTVYVRNVCIIHIHVHNTLHCLNHRCVLVMGGITVVLYNGAWLLNNVY